MDKLQKARLDLFNLMHGQIIPNSIMADICYVVDGKKFDKFKEIYQDPKKKYLLVVNDTTSEGFLEFWKELFPDEELCSKAVEFLQGRDFLEVKFSWKEELANFIRNEANGQKRPYLTQLADALYGRTSKFSPSQLLEGMLKKQTEAEPDYDVYWGFCLLICNFDLMSESLLPIYYQALDKHQNLWKIF